MAEIRSHAMLSLGGLVTVALLSSGEAHAKPPRAQTGDSSALVGRMRTRAGVVDLTVDTLAEGGAAHGLVEGLARVIADADVRRVQQVPQPESVRSHP